MQVKLNNYKNYAKIIKNLKENFRQLKLKTILFNAFYLTFSNPNNWFSISENPLSPRCH